MTIREYYDRINTKLLNLIPPGLGSILEVGCGTGALGAHYKASNPDTHYTGIELNPEAAELGRERIDRVITANVEQADEPELQFDAQSFDALVYGDVLEHLINPWEVLDRHSRWLKPEGYVIASIPNVQNWTILRDLMRGRWDYQDEGLLDRTHLRFFTLDSVKALFAQAGLRIEAIEVTQSHDPSEYAAIVPHMTALATWMGLDPQQFDYLITSHQFVVVARPVKRRLFVQTMRLGSPNSERVRTQAVDRWSNQIPGVRSQSETRQAILSLARPDEEKVFIWQDAQLPASLVQKQQPNLLARGYLILADVDRDPHTNAYLVDSNYLLYRSCHAIQTASPALADRVRPYNPHVVVFPNHLEELPIPRGDRDYDRAHIVLGSASLGRDWEPLILALNAVLAEFGDRAPVTVIHDQACFEAIDTPHKRFFPHQTYEIYQRILRAATIALLPLSDTPSNWLKSDVRFLDAASQGLAVLASPTVYGDTINDGETGLIYHSPEDFTAKLRELISDAALRDRLGRSAYAWVGAHRLLKHQVRDRIRWYYDMRHQLPQLNADLRDRAPELFSPASE
ncbi:MAG: methyltransferase domain-containing protein [Oscillatoriales cyanobacterium]|nr:MAG: methyltransferase domain-containing protein [Oscillatoriales cyanobacterium]